MYIEMTLYLIIKHIIFNKQFGNIRFIYHCIIGRIKEAKKLRIPLTKSTFKLH